jgi:hypothetical protein
MTRHEKLASIKSRLEGLSDAQLDAVVDLTDSFNGPTVLSSLSKAEIAAIDAALDRLDRGEGIPLEEVRSRLDAKLRAAGA